MSDAMPVDDVSAPRPGRFGRLRIAVSVFFGVLAVALCVLWVRSYWHSDVLLTASNYDATIASNNGCVRIMLYEV